jgi:hypothetical protein
MKEFTYKWKIHGHNFTGTYACQDEAALRDHISKYNGELLEVLYAEEKAVVEHPVAHDEPKPAPEAKPVNVCPKCLTEYDDSFKVCYRCNFTPLERKAVTTQEKYWDEFRRAPAEDARPPKWRVWVIATVAVVLIASAAVFFGWQSFAPYHWKRYHLGWSGLSLESPRDVKKIAGSADVGMNPAIQDMEIYKTAGPGDFALIFSAISYREGILVTIEREGKAAIAEMQRSFEEQGCTQFTYTTVPITKSERTGVLYAGSFLHPLKIKEEFQCIVLIEGSRLWFLFTLYSTPSSASIAKRIIDSVRIEAMRPKKAPKK